MTEVTITHFLSRVGVDVGYSKKKLTHAKLREILRELGFENIILNSNSLSKKETDILIVKDQNRKIGYYKNPCIINHAEIKQNQYVKSLSLEEIDARLEALNIQLQTFNKVRIIGLDKLKKISEILKQIEELDELRSIYREYYKKPKMKFSQL